MEIFEILPTSLEIKYDHITIDGMYISTIVVIQYETNINILNTIQSLVGTEEIEISFQVKRENNFEILKKLTNIIAESKSEINSVSKNQIDLNLLDNIKNKAMQLRKKIQIDNEQVYMLSTYVVIKEKSVSELINKQKKYINMLYSKQIIAKPSNFRQKEGYIATLPLLENKAILSKYTHSVFTEKALAKLFPFYVTDILNNNGILLGKANNNLCLIDVFSEKNNNYNMCVFGSSGAGKSYFIKLMIIKNAYKGIRQIIIDPEGEYVELIESLGGRVYTMENYNPFEICESFVESPGFFKEKVEQVVEYIANMTQIKDKEKIKKYVQDTYKKFGINEHKESLYSENNENKLYIKPQYTQTFPTTNDFIQVAQEFQEKLDVLSKNCISHNKSNNNELYCFYVKSNSVEEITKQMKIFMPKIYELIKRDTLIYFDEIWKSISLGQDRYVIENIYNMFKTLRKRKAGIVTISQDICDLFRLDAGSFGKSILNNANIKVLFKMEWNDIELLERILQSSDVGKHIKSLTRGNAYIAMGSTNFNLEIKATEYEHKLIEGAEYEKDINSNES